MTNQSDAQMFQELATWYIQAAETAEQLESLRHEIAALISELKLHNDDVVLVRAEFMKKKREILAKERK